MKIHIRVKELRMERGLTQKVLAQKLKVSVSTLSKFENNKLKYGIIILIKVSLFFDVSTDYIMGLSENRERILIHNKNFFKKADRP